MVPTLATERTRRSEHQCSKTYADPDPTNCATNCPGPWLRGAGRAHLLVALDVRVDEGPEDVRGEGQVGVDQLRLLVQAVQGEVVPELHAVDHVLLL
jgi:hypothetical protein